MKTIKQILSRYTGFLWALLKPLGVWGVFVIAALDGAAVGLPMDVIVAGYVHNDHARMLLYVLMASAGSAVGSTVLYVFGYLGGEAVLRKRIAPERFSKIHRSFDRHEFWALMFPAMLPPPTPFKLFVLAAAVFEMNFWHFLGAIFAGRFVRFLILAILTIEFGPQFVSFTGKIFSQHLSWVLGVLGLALLIWLVVRKRKASIAEQTEVSPRSPTES